MKLNREILIFGFFLFLSFTFWFFNALNKDYTTEITIPVEYTNVPENKFLFEKQPVQLKVRVNSNGYQLMNYKTTHTKPINIDLKQYKPKLAFGLKKRRYYILSSLLRDDIKVSIGKGLELKMISPDSLYFTMDEIISKKIPVRQNFEVNCKKQYMVINAPRLIPDSVVIKGVKSMLDTITEIRTEPKQFNNVEKSSGYELNLLEIPGTEISVNRINCLVDIEEFTEMEFDLPVEVINVPEDLNLKIFPAYAKIMFNVGFSRYSYVFKNQFKLVVDFKETFGRQTSVLIIKIDKFPDFISAVRISPKFVDYIIEKK
ncbi:MAG: hypothetical protein U0W24_16580 [Bacteroidales bacterium]